MAILNEALQERAQLVRIHEANCKIEYPTAAETNFRIAVMKRIGLQFALKELRGTAIEGPAPEPSRLQSARTRPPGAARS